MPVSVPNNVKTPAKSSPKSNLAVVLSGNIIYRFQF